MMNLKHWTWCLTLIRMKYDADFYKRFGDIIVANTITTAPCWMSFLETMARNSKCTMPELLMIHYQRPEAHDCKSYQDWINAGRQVKRGAIGILIRDKDNPDKVRYLFDAADTVGATRLWRFSRKLETDAANAIQAEFRVSDAISFPAMVEHAVSCLIDNYWYAHEQTILDGIMECWKGWDEYAAKLQFVDAAFYSTCYMILERCGYHPQSMYELSEFGCVPSFHSPKAMETLGEAIRSVGNQVLDVIEKTVIERSAQRDNSILAEGEHPPSAILKPKIKKEMEVR